MKKDVLTADEGKLALKIVRENILSILNDGTYSCEYELPDVFNEKLGVFVTLNKNNSLRGCIGYPEPYEKLIDALLDVSLAAAFDDPRFNPLTKDEYPDIEVEISVLTKPQRIIVDNYEEYLSKIELGVDGLIIEKGYNRGLFLPQVATEQNWNIEEYLINLCYKAGLPSDSWMDDDCVLYNFQAQIINE
ncbi:MAG: TIGR00296 family protein [Methanosphaera sp.]|nr:TIGR00296 family protein [Methanosphaera sp.]